MLQAIRDRVQGIFVWVILVGVIAAFAFVGVNSYLTDDGRAYVAKVNDGKIPLGDFQLALRQERAFRQQLFGDNINPALLTEDVLQRAALDRLITGEVVAQAASEAGFQVSNAQVGNQILSMKEFQTDGKFDASVYGRILNIQGYSQEHFEASIRKEMLSRQLINGLTGSSFATTHEINQLLALRRQQRRFAYAVLKNSDLVDDISVDDTSIQQYYDAHAGEFVTEEQVSVRYLELQVEDSSITEEPSDDILHQMYQQQIVEFSNGDERRASHILIKPADETPEADKAAKDKAEELYKQIEGGADFAELARKNSDDPGSARQGGDLGYFGRGVMVGAFEEKAFSMNKGEISEPLKSPYGYHIIKLTDIRKGDTKTFDEVRATLVDRYRNQKAEERFYDQVDRLTDLTYEHPETLEFAADDLGIQIQSTGLFTREHGSGIASEAAVREAAFGSDVLEGGYNSEVLTLSDNRALVLRVDEHRQTAQQPLDAVRDIIVRRLQHQQAIEQLQQIGDGIVAEMRDGEDPKSLVKKHGGEWTNSGFIDRNDGSVKRQVLNFIFTIQRPSGDKAVYAGKSLPDGDYVIAALYAVQEGDPAAVDDKQRQSVAGSRSDSLGQHLGARVISNLKKSAKITEYTENL